MPPSNHALTSLLAALPPVRARIALAVLMLSAIYFLADLPGARYSIPVALIAILYVLIIALRQRSQSYIDFKLTTGLDHPEKWPVYTKPYPIYKFVDIYRAIQTFVGDQPGWIAIRSEHNEALRALLNTKVGHTQNRKIKPPVMVARKISYEEETFLPADSFWRFQGSKKDAAEAMIIRLRLYAPAQQVHLEIATEDREQASAIMDTILKLASENSIYRNHLISIAFGPQIRGGYADADDNTFFDLVFQKELRIADDDIIFDAEIWTILQRAVVDFHHRRETLMRAGLPGKRGILFYGPPGTGKTYTCKYLFHQLKPITAIVATGNSLTQITAVCNIAKMLQPSLVILEDVDLVFSDRTTSAYSTILGDFMDQLDGFSDSDQVLFILTTNALERVEAAIKDRPGRISQCIYFGPPNAELRKCYLDALLRPYDVSRLDLDHVIAKTNGVSQAFLKELVFRAVQVATEGDHHNGAHVGLTTSHFTTALHDMTAAGGLQGKRIIGFHVDA